MAQTKKIYADGAVIFREGESGDRAFELISGSVDLLVKRDGKYAREGSVKAGALFGTENDTKGGIRLFTARASGRTVIKFADHSNLPATIPADTAHVPTGGFIRRLLQSFALKSTASNNPSAHGSYSNPGLLARLMEGIAADTQRIGVRVAHLSGHDSDIHTKHLISAIGHTDELQTRGLKKTLSINPEHDIRNQLERLAQTSRQYLVSQSADILIWGHVPEPGSVMHLHFITLSHWDQQAPGAFDLETTLALPVEFDGAMADLLRTVCLAAASPMTVEKKRLRATALYESLSAAEQAFNDVPPTFSDREKASLYLCYGNAIAASARPGYNSELLLQAAEQYRSALGSLSSEATPIDWAQAKKHLGSILHIEGERNKDPELIDLARVELEETLNSLDFERHRQPWAIIQNRLGMIYYRQGYEEGDTEMLRSALRCFQMALRVYTRSETPVRWTDIMSNFAQAAQILGGLMQSPDALATAINACRSVLEMRDRAGAPKAWATSQHNLGSALFLLGKQTRNIDRLEASVVAYESALAVYRTINVQRLALTTQRNLERARDLVDNYQPRNLPQIEWENALAEGIAVNPSEPSDISQPTVTIDDDDGLPWPGEDLPQRAQQTA